MILFALCCICRLVNCSNNNNINSAQHNNLRITPILVGTEKELSTLLFNSFHQHPKNTLIKRALDMLEGDDFIGMQSKRKRALDLMEGDGFGGGFDRKRRALDMMEGDDFIGLKKRSNMLRKRALDILEGDDFVGMQK
uniref:Uncharacterized protein n=1 Tax=Meloidogyne floridensis TaxID=298350 RepID=A0A915NP40_9BILA